MNSRNETVCFTSSMNQKESAAALIYLPVHIFLLPVIFGRMVNNGTISEPDGNLLLYAAALVFLITAEFRFMRREFDPLCDNMGKCFFQIILCYLIMMSLNLCVSGIVSLIEYAISGSGAEGNLNNSAIMDMAGQDYGKMSAIGIFMAPIAEEIMFRGAVFSGLYKHGRILAYAVSMLLFSVYHVWGYAVSDPVYWIFIIQYLPASFVLCRCYEKTNTIWAPVFLHMLVNSISFRVLTELEGLL